jgi:23S rRNA pseudouridine1911/1915/1917 synthase
MPQYTLTVAAEDAGKRLDRYLVEFGQRQELGVSRTLLQEGIRRGTVIVVGQGAVKAHYKVKADDVIEVTIEEKGERQIMPEAIPLDIIYEDADVAVINKQAGLVVHPAPGNYEHTMVNALLHRFTELSDINPQRPGIVHRLDKETSGLLVIAKNNFSHLALSKQFAEHSIQRTYVALVKGEVAFDEQVIDAPIGRHPHKRQHMAVSFSEHTRYAKTYYRTLKRSLAFSLLELKPFTGRTHQLRVHLAFIGHPILGDETYGKKNEFSRLALHARSLEFTHPRSQKRVGFSCDIPFEFTEFLKKFAL